MVLENASSNEPAFTPDLPASDIDPYAGDQNPTYAPTRSPSFIPVSPPPNQIYVNLNELPRQFSLFGTRPHPKVLVDGIKDSCRFATNVLHRPVTQDEANAFAFHFAKSLRIGSYGSPAGLVVGTVLAARGAKDYRFPFWTPFKEGSWFNKDVFGPLRGPLARATWHSTRLTAYWIVSATICQIFFGSYAISVSLAGRSMDPRLKEFTEALKERMRDGHGRAVTSPRVEDQGPGAKGSETYDMARQRRGVQGMGKRKQPEGGDDASPTGGTFGEEYMGTSGAEGFLSEEEVKTQADARLRTSREGGTSSPFSTDDSPTQTQSSRASRDPSPKPTGGSAWDRLRQGAMSGNGDSQSRSFKGTLPSATAGSRAPATGGDGSSTGDSFSFSSSDAERQLAQSEAQKDFDASLERERSGRDFGEEGGRKRRW